MAEGITKRSEDYSRWYTDIVMKAELADYAPVKGCMVIRPYGYAIWENITRILDGMIKETGHSNAYFPLFIPESFMTKEAEHVEGFAPECAVVTHGGGKKLEENLYVRPTSETIMYSMFSRWIRSWRDLPLLINQWANVVRWEMRTRLFIRTTEFLWQEGHTAHATHEESKEETLKMLGVYKKFATEYLAIPVFDGLKSDSEKFAGALKTYAIEGMMQDKRALQAGTSHDLGQNFSKAFDIKFQSKNATLDYVWQTSWGVSTRLVGALVMAHSDDQGLILPPKIAPVPVVLIPIYRDPQMRSEVIRAAREIEKEIAPVVKIKVDDREQYTPGWKFNEWELKGVPIRIEIGPRDIERQQVVLVRRDNGEKISVSRNTLASKIKELLDEVQQGIFNKALRFRDENTVEIDSYEKFKEQMENGIFAKSHCCQNPACEEKIKEDTKATIRVIAFDEPEEQGKCIICGNESNKRAIFAKAY
ncbi:MAG TPA: proline--tRNA ligase [Acidobacteriota bacterium]|nr:proline--tRNA ligase [Acidobacteriota bacterium]